MSKGLIWQDDENIIDVVYQSIYGLPIKEAMQVIKKYQEKQLIPIEWIKAYYKYHLMPKPVEWFEAIEIMIEDWEKDK